MAWVLLDNHPNIVQAVSVESLDNRLFIVLEYIEPDDADRNTLTHYIKNPVSPAQAVLWAMQFCDGMAYAASQGVTPHRDIKPDNIMITRNCVLKITDFGLARFWEGTLRSYDTDGYQAKSAAGTCPWMAPEQFEGRSDLRSDIYSFGVILYPMASGGKLPFVADSLEGYKKAHNEAPLPRLYNRQFRVIKKCLAKSPEKRYSDFHSLRTDLEKLYKSLTGMAPPPVADRIEPGILENNKGLGLYNVGLVDEAIWLYRKALRADLVMAETRPDRLATVHNNLGVTYDARDQVDMAIGEYMEALRLNPGLADAHNNMGTAYRAKGWMDDAMREYRTALDLSPDHAIARHNLGLSYAHMGDNEGAILEYEEAIRLKPGFVEARINLGLALAMTGRLEEAIGEYRYAARLRPDDAIIHFNLASALRAIGHSAEAVDEYRVALHLDSDNVEARYKLGLSLEEAGQLQDAINEYMAALHRKPGQPGGARRPRAGDDGVRDVEGGGGRLP